jgi:phosphoribosylglycinamide formyltransferase 1
MLKASRPLRVAVLCSRRAPGLLHLLEADPHRGRLFDIACVVTSEPDFVESAATVAAGVDVVRHPIAEFCAARSVPVYRHAASRRAYDAATVDLLERCRPDLVLLDGYLYLLTGPMLEAYGHRVINLHFSDLLVRRPDGRPAYAGLRAVRDALLDGRTGTCATVHLVNDLPDAGPPIVRSSPYPVSPMLAKAREWGATDMFKAYVFAHQEWMIRGASGMLLSAALELVATGRVDLDALALAGPDTAAPWLVDGRGRLTPPAALRICERLWGYQSASA